MNVKKAISLALICLIAVLIATVPAYFVAEKFLMAESFTGEIVKTQYSGQTYFVVPETRLESAILIDSEAMRHYILSEERLRLLGPQLLTGEE